MKPERGFVAERALAQHSAMLLRPGPSSAELTGALDRAGQRIAKALPGALAPLLSSRVEFLAGGMLMLNLMGLGLWWFWRHREVAAEPVPVLP